jgi:hypothetical protein
MAARRADMIVVRVRQRSDELSEGKRAALVGPWHFQRCAACLRTRSFMPETPDCLAQWAQQKVCSPFSTPWPMMRQPQCAHRGAMPSIAHSKLSNVMLRWP